jgi:UDP-glucuronate 4-epimerase
MTVLVTGAAGFVGLNIVEALLAAGEAVVGCDVREWPSAAATCFEALPGSLRREVLDIRDRAAVLETVGKHRPAKIVHAAAVAPTAEEELQGASACVAVNVGGTVNIADAALAAAVERLVFLSSAAVYGDAGFRHPVLDETTPAEPTSIYGVSKFAAERVALRYRDAGLDVVALRLGSVFGPWEHATSVRGTLSPMWQVLDRASRQEPVRLPRAGRRDWVYVRDVAAATLAALRHRGLPPPVVNVGSGKEFTVEEFCQLLATKISGLRWMVAPESANINFHSVGDRAPLSTTVLQRALSFTPMYDLEAATSDYVAWIHSYQRPQPSRF